jgi:hypothetical protein
MSKIKTIGGGSARARSHVHHPDPIVAYHMTQHKHHASIANAAKRSVEQMEKHPESKTNTEGLAKGRKLHEQHAKLADAHKLAVHEYGAKHTKHAFGSGSMEDYQDLPADNPEA